MSELTPEVVLKYLVNHEAGLLAVEDCFGPPEGVWEEIDRWDFDRLNRLGYELEGNTND